MKKIFKVFLIFLFLGGFASLASANLIDNPSFEDWSSYQDFDDWREYGYCAVNEYLAHTGNFSALLSDLENPSGVVSNKFNISEMGTYLYGAWFTLVSLVDPTQEYNNDRTGVTANIYFAAGGATYPNLIYDISADIPGISWMYSEEYQSYLSNWIFIGGTFDVSQEILNGELNIYLQNYDQLFSAVLVDDAIVEKVEPVPEPATLMLIGTGLVGFAITRKKFRR